MTPRHASGRRFSITEAARLFTAVCDLLIPAGLLFMLFEQLRIVDLHRGVYETVARCVLLLGLTLVVVHVRRVFTSPGNELRLARSSLYLFLLIAIALIRIAC